MLVNLHFSLKHYFFKSWKKCTFSACNFYTIILNLFSKNIIIKEWNQVNLSQFCQNQELITIFDELFPLKKNNKKYL